MSSFSADSWGFFFFVFSLENCLFVGNCLRVSADTPSMVEAKDGGAERDGGDEEDAVDIDHLEIQVRLRIKFKKMHSLITFRIG